MNFQAYFVADRFALDLCDTSGNFKGLYKMGLNNAKSQLPFKETFVPVIVDQGLYACIRHKICIYGIKP